VIQASLLCTAFPPVGHAAPVCGETLGP